MLGIGPLVASAIRPQLEYARRQGTYLGVAAVFGALTLVFAMLALFLALTYVMAPLAAALLCTALCIGAAVILLLIVRRRAQIRRAASARSLEEPERAQVQHAAALGAAKALAGTVLPVAVIGATVWMLMRTFSDDD